MEAMRYCVDGSWRRFERVVIAGSPLRIFRLTDAGTSVATSIEAGQSVARSRLVDRLLDGGAIHPLPAEYGSTTFTVDDVTIVTPQLGGVVANDGRIVVDDGSRPALVGATIRHVANRGPAAARNSGRRLVGTPLVAFVDADVTARAGWLERLIGHFDDDRVGMVAPRVTGEAGSPLDLGDTPARVRSGSRVSYVPGAAIVVRTAAFDSVGGFDEGLRFGEDVDFVWRLDDAGWGCRYEPASTVRHAPRPTLAARLRQHAGYGTSAAPLALRHPRALAPMTPNGWTAATWALIGSGHPVAALPLAVGSSAALIPKLPDVPASAAFGLAMRGHVGAARQIAHALRREWWPIVALVALVSRRGRWIALAAVLSDLRATPTDLAYGWGVWRGMRRHRTATPILPRLSAWPARRTQAGYGPRA
jgi:mycofactocin system glycosyltransferase